MDTSSRKQSRNMRVIGLSALYMTAMISDSATAFAQAPASIARSTGEFGRVEISTVSVPSTIKVRTATYTQSGKILISYASDPSQDERDLKLALIDEDGRNMREVFSGSLPTVAKDNGIRFMVFADNRRIHLGDFILECLPSLDRCTRSSLLPVIYPEGLAKGDHIAHRWSEIIVAPDNRHVAWTTLFSNYSALAFVGELRRGPKAYTIADTRVISTLQPSTPDPRHPGAVIPNQALGGEVKQFVHGGTAISLVGAGRRDTPDSAVQDLQRKGLTAITDDPGYTETTIFSPDERLGLTMTTRFSPRSDPAILGLVPRPYSGPLNMGLSMFAYTYAVTGVRTVREGNVGPALIDVSRSQAQPGYRGENLSTEPEWVFGSPISWHPGGTRGIWMEGRRGSDERRIRQVALPDYKPARPALAKALRLDPAYPAFKPEIAYGAAKASREMNAKVYGKAAGYLTYRREPTGVIEKVYHGFDDGNGAVYEGSETLTANPAARSTYRANLTVSGSHRGAMNLKVTFGPLRGKRPAEIVFANDEAGKPLSSGSATYDGVTLDVAALER